MRPRIAPVALSGAFIAALIAAPLAAEAQQTGKVFRVGVLGHLHMQPAPCEMFKEGLSQLGYSEGKQVVFIHRYAHGVPSRLPAIAAALVQDRPDVILGIGPASVAAAARATTTIPIVAVDLESDPLARGYAKTLARPGPRLRKGRGSRTPAPDG